MNKAQEKGCDKMRRTWLMLLLVGLVLLPACVGKHKALCMDIAEGGNAHIELGYFWDSANMTITGPIQFATVHEEAVTHPCLPSPVPTASPLDAG